MPTVNIIRSKDAIILLYTTDFLEDVYKVMLQNWEGITPNYQKMVIEAVQRQLKARLKQMGKSGKETSVPSEIVSKQCDVDVLRQYLQENGSLNATDDEGNQSADEHPHSDVGRDCQPKGKEAVQRNAALCPGENDDQPSGDESEEGEGHHPADDKEHN